MNVFNAANKLLLAVSGLPPLPEKGEGPVVTKSRVMVEGSGGAAELTGLSQKVLY